MLLIDIDLDVPISAHSGYLILISTITPLCLFVGPPHPIPPILYYCLCSITIILPCNINQSDYSYKIQQLLELWVSHFVLYVKITYPLVPCCHIL